MIYVAALRVRCCSETVSHHLRDFTRETHIKTKLFLNDPQGNVITTPKFWEKRIHCDLLAPWQVI